MLPQPDAMQRPSVVRVGAIVVVRRVATLAAAVGLLATGCGEDATDSLSTSPYTSASDAGIDSAAPGDSGSGTARAETLFRELLPELKTACGAAACHGGPNTSAPLWLSAPEYDSIKKYDASQTGDKKLLVKDVLSSRLFTKGVHTGPAMPQPDGKGNLGDKVEHWIEAEIAAQQGAKLPTTSPVSVTPGPNTIDIGALGTGIAGAKITFNAAISGSLVSLDTVRLVAPGTSGVHVVHPTFMRVPADATQAPIADPADQGSNVDGTAGAGKATLLGTGTYVLTGFKWQNADRLAIEFVKVEAAAETATDAGSGGCKNVAGFQNIAGLFTGAVVTPNCTASCHKAGGSGDGALDLDALVGPTPDYAAACAQALNAVTLADKAQSPLILHPTGQTGNHAGGKVSDIGTYTNMVMTWLAGE